MRTVQTFTFSDGQEPSVRPRRPLVWRKVALATVPDRRLTRRLGGLTALPAQGYDGEVPDFPLPARSVYYWSFEDKQRIRCFDEDATLHVRERELELWEWAWRTPQACAWSLPSERWRSYTVAMWVRTAVICESSDATAADKNSLHRFADQIGLTTAGLAEMGWKVAVDEVAERRSVEPEAPRPRRLRAAGDGSI